MLFSSLLYFAVAFLTQATSQHPALRAIAAPLVRVDALHYDFTIEIPSQGNEITGIARVTLRRWADTRIAPLDLAGLQVDEVRVNALAAHFSHNNSVLGVSLPAHPDSSWDTLCLTIRYHGQVKDGLIVRQDELGRWNAFGDNWPERAHYWLPCIDRPDDKATVTWNVIAPADREVVANGRFVSKSSWPDSLGIHRNITTWSESHPISTYLMVIGVGPLIRYPLVEASELDRSTDDIIPQAVYVQPEERSFLPGPFRYAGDILRFYSSWIGPFPFERLDHVQSLTRYGGMENASAIFYADQAFRRHSLGPKIIAHETAHQWFGDAVTESGWSHLWLSEGFATYFAELWSQHAFGDSLFRVDMARARDDIIESAVASARPVVDSLQTDLMNLLDTNSYQKGAWVLHMLRSMLGDSVFTKAIRTYYVLHRYSVANTDDLETAFENASHHNLRWFFDQWLRRPGYIDLSYDWHYSEANRTVDISIQQGTRFPAFRFLLTLEMIFANGKKEYRRVHVNATQSQTFSLAGIQSGNPVSVKLDPNVQLLAKFVNR